MRSPGDVNAAWRQFDPADYFDNVREVLDLVDGHTEPGPVRTGCTRSGTGARCSGVWAARRFLRREPEYRRRLYEEIRRLALERYGPEIEGDLPFNLRVRVTAPARRPLRGARGARPVRVASCGRTSRSGG